MLSAAAWPVIGTDSFADGQMTLNATDPATGIQSQVSLVFQRDTDTLNAGNNIDLMLLSFGMSAPDGTAIAAFSGDNPTLPDSYTVVISADQSQMRLTGTFYGYSYSGDTPNTAAIFVDIQWVQTSVQSRSDYSSLSLQNGERTLETSSESEGDASMTALVQWVQLPQEVMAELPGNALPAWDGVATSQGYSDATGQTAEIPASANIAGLVSQLSPPARVPSNSDIAFRQEPDAGAELFDPGSGALAGGVILLGELDSPSLAKSFSTGMGFYLNTGLQGGATGTIDGSAMRANGSGSGLATNAGAADPFATTPFTMSISLAAIPSSLKETFYKSVMTSEGSVSTGYQEIAAYDATVTGSLTLGDGSAPLSMANGHVETMFDVDVITPEGSGGSQWGPASPVSAREWGEISALSGMQAGLADAHGFIGPGQGERFPSRGDGLGDPFGMPEWGRHWTYRGQERTALMAARLGRLRAGMNR